MDFDANTAAKKPSGITDEARLSAASKRVTLAPLHDDVQPELKPNGSDGSEQGVDVPVANVPSDMESTSATTKSTGEDTTSVAAKPTPALTPATTSLGNPATELNQSLSQTPTAGFLPATPPVQTRSKLPAIILGSVIIIVAIVTAAYFVFL